MTPERIMNEPSKWALEAARDILRSRLSGDALTDRQREETHARRIQQAIDAATADKDHGIERLKAEFER